jgi:hypothetical protein
MARQGNGFSSRNEGQSSSLPQRQQQQAREQGPRQFGSEKHAGEDQTMADRLHSSPSGLYL